MSEFWRYHIRSGDTTTANGRVEARPQKSPVMYGDQHAAFEGDPVWCPACESHGITRCVPPYRPDTGPDGRQTNLDGDLCLCNCPKPPRLVARLHDDCVGFTANEIAEMPGSANWLSYAGHAIGGNRVEPFDEQARMSNPAAEGVPYRIEVEDGRVISGSVGTDGFLPRVETVGDAAYTVYWGDEALARVEGEAS